MPEIVMQCPLCASGSSRLFDRGEFHGHLVENRTCLACGLVYQSPRMTEIEAAAFYSEEYRLLQEGSKDPTSRNMAVQDKRARSLLEFARPVIPAVSRHLDIGCSMGILLQYFQDNYHDQAVGVEPGEAHRARARENGITVYTALEELERSGEAPFDLVSLAHVLEHLPDPVAYLTHLRQTLLAADGWLLLEVPNLYAHNSFELAHLVAFSPHSLCETLRRAGFEIIKFEKHGRPNSGLFPLFLTALCRPMRQPVPAVVRPEQGVAFKRRLGMLRRWLLERLLPGRAWLVG
jgi:SAM-dependent methyltransferase